MSGFSPFWIAFWPAFLNFNVQPKNMAKLDANSTLKRLQNRYRLVVMNEDTYEEVVKFKLSRLSVYIFLSSVFVVLLGLIIALLVFTPLKYYLPGAGYGDAKQRKQYEALAYTADSLENEMRQKEKFYNDLQKVLKGNLPVLDTNKLDLPKAENMKE